MENMQNVGFVKYKVWDDSEVLDEENEDRDIQRSETEGNNFIHKLFVIFGQ